MPPVLPESLHEFVELVIPELQRRGLFRTEYEGQTLRENLGLARPTNQFSTGPGDRGPGLRRDHALPRSGATAGDGRRAGVRRADRSGRGRWSRGGGVPARGHRH
jgi:hypothetical protein